MKSLEDTPELPSNGTGTLYVVATPIGNLEDITKRALRVLEEVDVIACEDTRHTGKLLNHYGIRKRMVSYHEHNELTRSAELVLKLEDGAQVALVSDAGTPLLSDPGHRLVTLCIRHHIPVVPIPGASALLAGLTASGLPIHEFTFGGFLPARPGERRKFIDRFARETRTVAFYEAPHRLADALADLLERLGPRQAVIARELTKLHEEFLRGDLSELLASAQCLPLRGELIILIGPPAAGGMPQPALQLTTLEERVEQIIRETQVDRKAALKLAARERGISKREAYKQLLIDR